MSRKPKFCVITNQRSGSTWLTRLLDSHPQIRMLKGDPLYVHSGYYDNGLPRYCDYKKTDSSFRPFVLFNYFELYETYENESHDILGYKVMYNHIKHNPEFLIKLLTDNYRIVHLARRNHLDLMISRAVGKQYEVFHLKKNSKEKRPVTLDVSTLIKKFDFQERAYQYAKLFLKLVPIASLEVHYETLATNKEKTLSAIANFLEVENNPALFESELKKVNVGSYEDKIINYEEVVQTIKKLKYASFLNC